MRNFGLMWAVPIMGAAFLDCGAPGNISTNAVPLGIANPAKNAGDTLTPDALTAATIAADSEFEASPYTRAVCPEGTGAAFRCYSHIRLANNGQPLATSTPQGYAPSDFISAYSVPASTADITVAVVDADGYTNAESDLAAFRAKYGLPACTTANGCFKKVGQTGSSSTPTDSNTGWQVEAALDLDAVSATCPTCKLLLVEATNDTDESNLLTAINGAVTDGAVVVSNSWGYPESSSDVGSNTTYIQHAGISILAAGGDHGYAPSYPADSPDLIAVGGTSLVQASNARGWTETVWNDGYDSSSEEFWGTGSACSAEQTQPSFQSGASTGCTKRATNDISADADNSETSPGLAIYCTEGGASGWTPVGGTSLASPLVAGIIAATNNAGIGPDYFYNHTNYLNDITSGTELASSSKGGGVTKCPDAAELCTAQAGWDGPTGWGTPNAALWAAGGSSTGGNGSSSSSGGSSSGSSSSGSSSGSTSGGSSSGSSSGGTTGGTTGSNPIPGNAEVEPNNSTSAANLLTASVPMSGAISAGRDVDYFRIQVPKGSSVDLSLTGLSADLDLRLYNSSHQLVGISDQSSTTDEEINGTLKNSVYYVEVAGYDGAESNYTLALSVQ